MTHVLGDIIDHMKTAGGRRASDYNEVEELPLELGLLRFYRRRTT